MIGIAVRPDGLVPRPRPREQRPRLRHEPGVDAGVSQGLDLAEGSITLEPEMGCAASQFASNLGGKEKPGSGLNCRGS